MEARFMTKKQRLERAEAIIDQYSIGQKFNDKHLKEFEELTGCFFTYIKRVPHKPGQKPARHLECTCPEWGVYDAPFSWRKAVQKLSDAQYKKWVTNQAMREAIQPDQKAWLVKQEKVCTICHSTENPQADHREIPFLKIQSSFADQFGEPEVKYDDAELRWKIKNEQQWIEFHNGAATYQVLCRSCNASKGAR